MRVKDRTGFPLGAEHGRPVRERPLPPVEVEYVEGYYVVLVNGEIVDEFTSSADAAWRVEELSEVEG